MAKRNSHKRRVKKLIIASSIATVLLVTSTYAWFIGMRTVNVNSFDVKIAAVDGLTLSLDGVTWTENLDVTSATPYNNNTNTWAPAGLKPVSSVGVIDKTSSTLQLYEKASLTATNGGYRLLASRVNNNTKVDTVYPEAKGYVAFDLFIKNLSGDEYYAGAYNEKNEEAIYLTNDSTVKVSSNGGVAETGIENSVRVAFAQIGRVIATTTSQATITGLSCADVTVPEGANPKDYATPICRTATIWEPNDRAHTTDAINHYNNSCKSRNDDTGAYEATACSPLVDGLAKTTYAISGEINYVDEDGDALDIVDIYDGADYNGYDGSANILGFNTFTDSEKLVAGAARNTFFTLAPNSITKVRVYVYLEGQDVDNYDLASIGKKISVNFGFTKERYNEDDINYQGPITNEGDGPFVWDEDEDAYVSAADKTKPYITLAAGTDPVGEFENDTVTIEVNDDFVLSNEVTATAFDKKSTFNYTPGQDGEPGTYTVATVYDQPLEAEITHTGTVNKAVPGTYQVVYSVKDAAGNLGTKVLTVIVVDPDAGE